MAIVFQSQTATFTHFIDNVIPPLDDAIAQFDFGVNHAQSKANKLGGIDLIQTLGAGGSIVFTPTSAKINGYPANTEFYRYSSSVMGDTGFTVAARVLRGTSSRIFFTKSAAAYGLRVLSSFFVLDMPVLSDALVKSTATLSLPFRGHAYSIVASVSHDTVLKKTTLTMTADTNGYVETATVTVDGVLDVADLGQIDIGRGGNTANDIEIDSMIIYDKALTVDYAKRVASYMHI